MAATLDTQLQRASAAYGERRLREAELELRDVLAHHPGQPDALFLLGSIACDIGRLKDAERLLSAAVARRPLEPAFLIGLGNALQRQGHPERAAESYEQAARLRPGFAEAWMNLGNALLESRRPAEALERYRRALALRPGLLGARIGSGHALLDLGRTEEGLELADALLGHLPNLADALHLRAAALSRAGNETDAIAIAGRALQVDPRHAAARLFLAARLIRAGDFPAALVHAGAVVRADPRNVRALDLQAEAHARMGDTHAAISALRRLLQLRPDRTQVRFRLALQLQLAGRHHASAREYALVVRDDPRSADAHSNRGLDLLEIGELEQARAAFDAALAIDPDHADAHYNLALLLRREVRVPEAVSHLERVLLQRPDSPDVLNNLGNALCDLGAMERGMALLRRAAELSGDLRPRLNLSIALLSRGEFREGWRLMQEHWARKDLAEMGAQFPFPWWRGEPLAGRRVLVWAEQGLGDEIMYVSMIPDLLSAGAQVTLQCHERLAPLFARSFAGVSVVPKRPGSQDALAALPFDFQMPMSWPTQFLRNDCADFPRHSGYLRADPARVAFWRERLAASGAGPVFGLSWRGGTEKTGARRRSSRLEDWLPILRTPGARFVNLQYGDCAAELLALERQHGIRVAHWQEAIDDYDETAALVSALDGVVSVCTAVIHLSGALARRTEVLVPYYPGWRYLRSGESLPWYPSVRLIRQQAPNRWDEAVARVARELVPAAW